MVLIRREHTDTAISTTATGTILIGDTSIVMAASTGWPTGGTGAFTATINKDKPDEERILVATRSGTTLSTITRGYAGTAAAQHTGNPTLDHTFSGLEADEDNQAVMNTIGAVTSVGDLLVGSGLNTLGRLALGASGTVPTSNGTTLVYATPTVPVGTTVATLQNTTSTVFTDLASAGPAATATVTATGKAKVTVTSEFQISTSGEIAAMGFALSGANTVAASVPQALIVNATGPGADVLVSAVFLLSGLAAGSTTFTAKYRTFSATTVGFANRSLIVEAY